jgi:hypothetical protein
LGLVDLKKVKDALHQRAKGILYASFTTDQESANSSIKDLIYMMNLVHEMENSFEKRPRYFYKGEVHERIDYRLIDFNQSRHAETFLELDFVWGEVSCAGDQMSEAIAKVYAVIKPALTLLGLRYSSVPKKQAQLDSLYRSLIKVSQLIARRRYLQFFNRHYRGTPFIEAFEKSAASNEGVMARK